MKNSNNIIKVKVIEDDLYNKYGSYMNAADVGRYLGLTSPISYGKWLNDVEYTEINNRKKYYYKVVANKIYQSTYPSERDRLRYYD